MFAVVIDAVCVEGIVIDNDDDHDVDIENRYR